MEKEEIGALLVTWSFHDLLMTGKCVGKWHQKFFVGFLTKKRFTLFYSKILGFRNQGFNQEFGYMLTICHTEYFLCSFVKKCVALVLLHWGLRLRPDGMKWRKKCEIFSCYALAPRHKARLSTRKPTAAKPIFRLGILNINLRFWTLFSYSRLCVQH